MAWLIALNQSSSTRVCQRERELVLAEPQRVREHLVVELRTEDGGIVDHRPARRRQLANPPIEPRHCITGESDALRSFGVECPTTSART